MKRLAAVILLLSISVPVFAEPQHYICRGNDPRVLGKVGAALQTIFSAPFKWKHGKPNGEIKIGKQMITLWPPFVAINIPYKRGRWATVRFGWRYDANCEDGRYIADVIIKLREDMPLYY